MWRGAIIVCLKWLLVRLHYLNNVAKVLLEKGKKTSQITSVPALDLSCSKDLHHIEGPPPCFISQSQVRQPSSRCCWVTFSELQSHFHSSEYVLCSGSWQERLTSQRKGFSPECWSEWTFKDMLRLNDFPQVSQVNGISFVWAEDFWGKRLYI